MLSIDKKYIDYINKIIDANENLIEYNYKNKESQILINEKLIDKINIYIDSIKEEIDSKNFLKLSIRECFELLEYDIVISKHGHIFIKLIDKIEKTEVSSNEENTIANRYNGFSEEEVKSFYFEFFSDIENKNFLPIIARTFVNIYFNEKKIMNDIYEKKVFSYIHNIILDNLVAIYDNSDGFFKGFAGYIFRHHFKEVFEYIADLMLNEISMGNGYIIEFLNYYSSGIVVSGGNKFQVPIIEAKDGLRWNVISMMSIAKIYTKTEKSIIELRKNIITTHDNIYALYIDDFSPVEYHTSFIKKKQQVEQKISSANEKLDKYVDSLILASTKEEKNILKKEVKSIENLIENLRIEKSELSKKILKRSVLQKYKELQTNMETLTRQLNHKQKIIQQNMKAYTSMRDSLVKALMSKKKIL